MNKNSITNTLFLIIVMICLSLLSILTYSTVQTIFNNVKIKCEEICPKD
jgi:hypothetical protein